MIAILILMFTALHSPITWITPLKPLCYLQGAVMVGYTGYKFLRYQLKWTSLDFPFALLIGAAGFSTMFSTDPRTSLDRLATMIAYWSAYHVVKFIPRQIIIKQIVIAGWVIFGACLIATVGGWWYQLGNRNVLAATILLCTPFGDILNARWKLCWFLLAASAIISTLSLSGVGSMIVCLIVLWNLNRWCLVAGGLGLTALAMLVKPYSIMIRATCIWPVAIQTFLSKPFSGVGPGTISHFLAPRCEPIVPHAHNIFLTNMSEIGILGLIAFCFFVWQTWKHRQPGMAWAALCGFAVFSMVDDPIWFWSVGLGVMTVLAIMMKGENHDTQSLQKTG